MLDNSILLNQITCFTPFTLKIVKRSTMACSKCPWFAFCWGCAINPFSSAYVEIKHDDLIVVEWCEKIAMFEINPYVATLVFNHKSVDTNMQKLLTFNDNTKYDIKECLDSVKKQTFNKLIEIIIVNDGSKTNITNK